MKGLIENGFQVFITGVSSEGLGKEWIGRTLDPSSLQELEELSQKYRFNVDGEGGEYETLVTGGPHFAGRLELVGTVDWDGRRGTFEIEQVHCIA